MSGTSCAMPCRCGLFLRLELARPKQPVVINLLEFTVCHANLTFRNQRN